MFSFAKFRHFSTLQITSRILCPFCYLYRSISKEFLMTPVFYLCFAIRTGFLKTILTLFHMGGGQILPSFRLSSL